MRRGARGFTLVELLIAIAILAIAIIGLLFTFVWMSRMQAVNDETTRAMRAAEQALEQMYGNTPFADVYRRYNAAVGDEAVAPSYAYPYPVAAPLTFEVRNDGQIVFGPAGTAPLLFVPPTGSPPGTRVGTIQFPTSTTDPTQLDENQCAALGFTGTQADLNANGVMTDTGLAAYTILPVVVTLQFESVGGGSRTITYRKVLVSR